VVKEGLDFAAAHLARVFPMMKEDVAPDPREVRLFRWDGIVSEAKVMSDLIKWSLWLFEHGSLDLK